MIFAPELVAVYKLLIKPFLFLFDPERVHYFAINFLKSLFSFPGIKNLTSRFFRVHANKLERTLFGITFPNPVGLAAGFDKDAKMLDTLDAFGFGFIEIGTITPKPQEGNPKPRLFRLPQDNALINRMGFNNGGVAETVKRLKKRKSKIIVGGNIGKNKSTPNDVAYRDYEYCLETMYDFVDYFVVNISSPNTPNLRELQEKEPLKELLTKLMNLIGTKKEKKPLLLKIAPDLSMNQVDDIADIVKQCKLDGIIASNTTISRENLQSSERMKEEQGGLSGKPVASPSTILIQYLRQHLGPDFPIIGVGGIFTAQDALDKLNAGADLVQVYTGFIYEGPGMIKKINKGILEQMH